MELDKNICLCPHVKDENSSFLNIKDIKEGGRRLDSSWVGKGDYYIYRVNIIKYCT